MKKFSLLAALLLVTQALHAEPSKIDDIVAILQEAKTSSDPAPLLEKAKGELNKYKPGPNGNKEVMEGIGPKKRAAAAAGAKHMKSEAETALEKAIESAKSSSPDLQAKIDAAIAEVHHTGLMKH